MKGSILLFISLLTLKCTFSQIQIDPTIRSVAVLVQFKNSSGSGFYLQDSSHVYFITAYHVIYNLQTNLPLEDTVTLISYRSDVENDPKTILNVGLKDGIGRYIKVDPRNDIVAIKVASLHAIDTLGNQRIDYLPHARRIGVSTRLNFWLTKDALKFGDVLAGSDIYVIGYPKSLGLQGNFDLDRPLFRKGIVAGKDFTFHRIIGDGAVYFGNSGGIVVEMYMDAKDISFKLIGLVSQYIPFNDILLDTRGNIRSVDAKNSGYSVIIPADKILELTRGL